jgi:hypothetical protein
MNITCYDVTNIKNTKNTMKGRQLRSKLLLTLATVAMLALVTLPLAGCQVAPAWEGDLRVKVANEIADTTVASMAEWDKEVKRIENMLDPVEIKLQKLEQVAEPILKWIDIQKADAIKYQWTPRLVEITDGLNEVKNDQFEPTKVQFIVEMLPTGAMRYSSIILIKDISTGKTSSYEQLHDEFQEDISILLQQREGVVQVRNAARSTGLSVVDQYKNWKVQQVNKVTYNISGPGLGMNSGLTDGTWTYYLGEVNKIVPADAAAKALKRVLTGK